jgi:hypothetical protein
VAFDHSDRIVFFCGIAGAFLLFAYSYLIDERQTPWDRQWLLAFPLLWSWLLPLAIALLADLRSIRRWTVAIVVYAIVLPALSALSLFPVGGVAPLQRESLIVTNPLGTVLIPALLGFLFMPLIAALDRTQPLGNYSGVFRAAWRLTAHGVLAGTLAICTVTLLYLGAKLFELIGLTVFVRWFEKAAFWRIVLPITFALSLIGIQRRPPLAKALQRSWLTLNGLMLPLASALGVTFVVALGAQLALGMRASTLSASVLIGFSAIWINLINAVWQDKPDNALFGPTLRRLLRWSLYCLLPLTVLALYNVLVRVDQYGWTVPRVWATFAATLAVLYSAGYALAIVRPAQFHPRLAATNYAATFCAIVLLMAFNTPALDPRHVTAASQTQRLIEGRLELKQFDFPMMIASTGPYGRAALRRLAEGAANDRDPKIADLAQQALAGQYISATNDLNKTQKMPSFTVYPTGRTVPLRWWSTVSRQYSNEVSGCMPASDPETDAYTKTRATPHCVLIFADLTGTGHDNLILYVPASHPPPRTETFRVFTQNAAGEWQLNEPLTH